MSEQNVELHRHALVVWLASSRTYLVGRAHSLFNGTRHKFGVGVDA
jgi:hypothetical protein